MFYSFSRIIYLVYALAHNWTIIIVGMIIGSLEEFIDFRFKQLWEIV